MIWCTPYHTTSTGAECTTKPTIISLAAVYRTEYSTLLSSLLACVAKSCVSCASRTKPFTTDKPATFSCSPPDSTSRRCCTSRVESRILGPISCCVFSLLCLCCFVFCVFLGLFVFWLFFLVCLCLLFFLFLVWVVL